MDRFSAMSSFVRAVELGSFSRVAEVVGSSPQIIGKHIKGLEQYLGVRLLNRTTRRQSLTEFGRLYYVRARAILTEMDEAEKLAATMQSAPIGRIRINAPVTFGLHSLAPRLPEFLSKHPKIEVDLTLSNNEVDLFKGGFDAVFRVGSLSDSSLMARALAPYKLVACASPAYLAAAAPIRRPMDLSEHQCLSFAHTELRSHWTFDGPEGRTVVPVQSRYLSDHGEALFWAAVAGIGVILQPLDLVRHGLDTGRLVTILPEHRVPSRPMHVLFAPDRQATPKLRSFLDFAVSSFR
jgi:DNA-binding transcriptional LysR family regulator